MIESTKAPASRKVPHLAPGSCAGTLVERGHEQPPDLVEAGLHEIWESFHRA